MTKYSLLIDKVKRLFVGIDVHRLNWHVTIQAGDAVMFSGSIPGTWEALQQLLNRYSGHRLSVVYEASCFGFWLYERLLAYGAECMVAAPSLIPQEYGNRVKTDRRDSRKLAWYLSKGLLKAVWVPSRQQLYHRQVIRRRHQLLQERVRTQNRIKAELTCFGISLGNTPGAWSKRFLAELQSYQWDDRWMQSSFERLLTQYHATQAQIDMQTKLLHELAEDPMYRDDVQILCSVDGVGVITAMIYLLELGDVRRFRTGKHLGAYIGLTPSQYSSADHVRMGRITRIGKNTLRAALVEASWMLIRKDPAMAQVYERIKARAGGKRAIVAVARRLAIRMRRILIDRQHYVRAVAA